MFRQTTERLEHCAVRSVLCYTIYTHIRCCYNAKQEIYTLYASYIVYLYPVKRAKAMSVQRTARPSHSDLNGQLKNRIPNSNLSVVGQNLIGLKQKIEWT